MFIHKPRVITTVVMYGPSGVFRGSPTTCRDQEAKLRSVPQSSENCVIQLISLELNLLLASGPVLYQVLLQVSISVSDVSCLAYRKADESH